MKIPIKSYFNLSYNLIEKFIKKGLFEKPHKDSRKNQIAVWLDKAFDDVYRDGYREGYEEAMNRQSEGME